MADYLGDFAEDATVRGSFNTRDAAGAPITLAGSPTLAVYKDAGVSESTAGVTLTVDFDSRTGHHVFVVDTSADAFYATGSDYRVVLTAGTVDGTSVVGVEVGKFSIQNRYMRGTNNANTTAPDNATIASIEATVNSTSLAVTQISSDLGDIPTVAEFNARTLPSADYFVVSDYTAPDNTSIAAILVDTNELQANQNNWLTADVSGLSTLTAQQVWEYVTRTLTSAGSGGATAQEVWEYATRTLTATSDSAGVTTLLSRVPGTIRIATDDVAAETAQTTAIRNGLALEATSQIILADTNELQSRFATMVEDDGESGWQFTVLALANAPAGGGGGSLTQENIDDIADAVATKVAPAISAENEAPSTETILQVFERETTTQQLVLYLQDRKTPKSLAGFTLEVLFETESGTFVARVQHASITVSGTDSNIISFAYPAAVTNDRDVKVWSLRDANDPRTVFLSGTVKVLRAANKVS